MRCSSCGSELVPGTTFCPICGARVMDQGFDEPMSNTADHAQQYWDQSQAQPEQQYWAQPQQFQPDSAPAPMSMAPAKKPRRGKRVAAGLAIAVVVIAVGVGGFAGFSFWQKAQHQKMVDQTTAAVEKTVDEQYGESFGGFVPNNYVNPSTYKVKSVKVSSVTENNGLVSGSAEAVTANRSFRSTMDFTFTGVKDSGGTVSNVTLKLNDKSTEPKRGIDFDEENGLTDLDPELDGSSCTVKQEIPGGAPWYYDPSYHQEYSYYFEDDEGWCLSDSGRYDDDGDSDPMLDISGTYEDSGGAATPDIYLKISNYDEDEGTISVELSTDYSLSRKKLSGRMLFRKDDIELEDIDDSGYKGFRIGGGGGLVTSAEEITGAEAGDAALVFVLNPSSPGGINVYRGDDQGLSVQTGYGKAGRYTLPVMTGVTGGMMSGLSEFSAWSFENNTLTPQFVKE